MRIFHISPDCCGEAQIARIFRTNGHEVALHEDGRLAADILYAEGRGLAPLRPWRKARLLTGLYRRTPHWRPPLEAWRRFAFLDQQFPQARFLLTSRRREDWIAQRLARDEGRAARAWAHHLGLGEDDLPEVWARHWDAHLAAVRAHFAGSGRLIELDLDRDTPADLARLLGDLVPLPVLPISRWKLEPGQRRAPPRPASAPPDWAADLARFCLGTLRPGTDIAPGALSRFACHWDGAVSAAGAPVTDPEGVARQMAVLEGGAGPVAVTHEGRHFKLVRAEGVVNDILRLGRRDPVWMDMEDSRWLGSPEGVAPGRPVLCHNRRAGAVNAVLWPLPDQHAIGLPGFDPAAAPDEVPWHEKEDRLVWRGMISGSEMRPGVKPGPASHVWLERLEAAEDDAARAAAWEGLARTNRMAFLARYRAHPDFDIAAVMAPRFARFADHPRLAPFCAPRQPRAFFHRFRYQLCLTGYDHGSNFIPAIDSRSVLLAEEDGWEVFYSGRFRPWVHYIPVSRHLADIEEKLAWARAHPDECQRMSGRARHEAAHLRDPAARRRLMSLILDGLAAAR
ncbi:glycosyl transferase family 90 [Paracoccus tibetensis]|uniref:Glycosyl transferase family 90 n=1 Tax=Paracoccus tibetensis TaxID=336292 RepID=A0A1G5ISA9_9RHOB|nr:glycosyl transferase family 90 [Paracoccus tibetensis]SCY78308.1 Glycosyl transferase family 90 [Paracoccus tibetensis]